MTDCKKTYSNQDSEHSSSCSPRYSSEVFTRSRISSAHTRYSSVGSPKSESSGFSKYNRFFESQHSRGGVTEEEDDDDDDDVEYRDDDVGGDDQIFQKYENFTCRKKKKEDGSYRKVKNILNEILEVLEGKICGNTDDSSSAASSLRDRIEQMLEKIDEIFIDTEEDGEDNRWKELFDNFFQRFEKLACKNAAVKFLLTHFVGRDALDECFENTEEFFCEEEDAKTEKVRQKTSSKENTTAQSMDIRNLLSISGSNEDPRQITESLFKISEEISSSSTDGGSPRNEQTRRMLKTRKEKSETGSQAKKKGMASCMDQKSASFGKAVASCGNRFGSMFEKIEIRKYLGCTTEYNMNNMVSESQSQSGRFTLRSCGYPDYDDSSKPAIFETDALVAEDIGICASDETFSSGNSSKRHRLACELKKSRSGRSQQSKGPLSPASAGTRSTCEETDSAISDGMFSRLRTRSSDPDIKMVACLSIRTSIRTQSPLNERSTRSDYSASEDIKKLTYQWLEQESEEMQSQANERSARSEDLTRRRSTRSIDLDRERSERSDDHISRQNTRSIYLNCEQEQSSSSNDQISVHNMRSIDMDFDGSTKPEDQARGRNTPSTDLDRERGKTYDDQISRRNTSSIDLDRDHANDDASVFSTGALDRAIAYGSRIADLSRAARQGTHRFNRTSSLDEQNDCSSPQNVKSSAVSLDGSPLGIFNPSISKASNRHNRSLLSLSFEGDDMLDSIAEIPHISTSDSNPSHSGEEEEDSDNVNSSSQGAHLASKLLIRSVFSSVSSVDALSELTGENSLALAPVEFMNSMMRYLKYGGGAQNGKFLLAAKFTMVLAYLSLSLFSAVNGPKSANLIETRNELKDRILGRFHRGRSYVSSPRNQSVY